MKSKNKFVTDSALHYDSKTGWNTNFHMEINLPDDDTSIGFGRSITPGAFRKMVGDKLIALKNAYQKLNPQPDEIALQGYLNEQKCAVEFGRESILRVLSQKDCIGLRFTFCLNDEGKESIIVSGLTEEEVEENINGKPQKRRRTCMIGRDVYRADNLGKPGLIMPFDDEKGVGKSYGDFVNESEISMAELLKGDEQKVTMKFTNHVLGLR
jgi:hypothetical protein